MQPHAPPHLPACDPIGGWVCSWGSAPCTGSPQCVPPGPTEDAAQRRSRLQRRSPHLWTCRLLLRPRTALPGRSEPCRGCPILPSLSLSGVPGCEFRLQANCGERPTSSIRRVDKHDTQYATLLTRNKSNACMRPHSRFWRRSVCWWRNDAGAATIVGDDRSAPANGLPGDSQTLLVRFPPAVVAGIPQADAAPVHLLRAGSALRSHDARRAADHRHRQLGAQCRRSGDRR